MFWLVGREGGVEVRGKFGRGSWSGRVGFVVSVGFVVLSYSLFLLGLWGWICFFILWFSYKFAVDFNV